MNIDQFLIEAGEAKYSRNDIVVPGKTSFILVFTSRAKLESPDWLDLVFHQYPGVPVVTCSTSGEIYESGINEDTISVLAVQFERTSVRICAESIGATGDSGKVGEALAKGLWQEDLKHVLVFSDGWQINGSALVNGIYSHSPKGTSISGGLAGDGANFSRTMVGLDRKIEEGMAVAIGLYGDQLEVGFGSHGGWNEMGESLEVTEARGREIWKLNGQSALEVYKDFLGKDAYGLPGTALLYPLSVELPGADKPLVRTVFNVDQLEGTISLGEPVAEGTMVKFMRAKFDDLIGGVQKAAQTVKDHFSPNPEFALVVSCIGRKLLFDQRIEEEIQTTREVLGSGTAISGFYSYGEICPVEKDLAALHHQMLTITVFAEKAP